MRLAIVLALTGILLIGGCTEKPKPNVFKVHVLTSPADQNSSLPYLFSNADKTLLSWVESLNDSLVRLRYSQLRDGVWHEPQDINSGVDWFVNWADFPAIAENNGHLFSHILKKSSAGTYSYDIKVNLKPKLAKAWKIDIPLHTDNTATEHGFVTAIPYRKNSFFVTWLDGRNTEKNESGERGAMTLRTGEVAMDGKVSNEGILDSRTCDCCQTTAAITANGPVVLYRDRSENEIRDISIVRQIDGEWTEPKAVHHDNWKINGCPVNGPKAASLENALAVAWFTGANEAPAVKIAFSKDNGANFEEPITIESDKMMGRVDIVLIDMDTALVSYMESKDKSAQLKVVKINRSGNQSRSRVIAEMSSSRKTGFPQMELVADKVYFAWTDVTNSRLAVQTAYILVSTL